MQRECFYFLSTTLRNPLKRPGMRGNFGLNQISWKFPARFSSSNQRRNIPSQRMRMCISSNVGRQMETKVKCACPFAVAHLLQNTPTSSLQRGKITLTSVLIWHATIWWYGFRNTWALENIENLFIAITPRSTQSRSGNTWSESYLWV